VSEKPNITLHCPQCGRNKEARRDDGDPPGTAIVVAHCDECDGEDNGVYPEYFKADGTQILYQEQPAANGGEVKGE